MRLGGAPVILLPMWEWIGEGALERKLSLCSVTFLKLISATKCIMLRDEGKPLLESQLVSVSQKQSTGGLKLLCSNLILKAAVCVF